MTASDAIYSTEVPVPAAPSSSRRILPLRRYLPTALVAAIGVAVSVAGAQAVLHVEQRGAREAFEHAAQQKITVLRDALTRNINALSSIRGLYNASIVVGRPEFGAFVSELLNRLPGIQALEWIPVVPHEARAAFEAGARSDGFESFQFTERGEQGEMMRARDREEYYPIYYVEPYLGNQAVLGFDLGTDKKRLRALRRARDTGKAVATARITLVQGLIKDYGFLVFMPIYHPQAPTNTMEQRRRYLRGFALGTYRIGAMMEATLRQFGAGDDLDFFVYDQTPLGGTRFLYANIDGRPVTLEAAPPRSSLFGGLHTTSHISVAGREWQVILRPSAADAAPTMSWTARGLLAAGLLLTTLLASHILMLRRRNDDIERQVVQRTTELAKVNMNLQSQICERERAERDLARYTEELRRSNAELEQFAYIASHDLQEPLRKVQAFGNRLEQKFGQALPEEGRDYVRRMQNASMRMQTLIQDMLAYSRVTTKGQPFEPVDLNIIARDVVADLEVRVTEVGAKIEISDLPTVHADPVQMRQLLQNLVGNALKFSRPGVPPHVLVRSAQATPDGPESGGPQSGGIEIADNGIGIAQEHRERVFGMFQRLHSRSAYEGTGIGLAICRRIVERHQGHIAVDGQPGEGTTFRITLPMAA